VKDSATLFDRDALSDDDGDDDPLKASEEIAIEEEESENGARESSLFSVGNFAQS